MPTFEKNAITDKIAARYTDIAQKELGLTVQSGASGGGVDSCCSFQACPAIEGMGIGSGGHSDGEFADTETIAPRACMVLRMTQDVMDGKLGFT